MVAGQQQVEAGTAAHGAEVQNAVLPLGLVAQVGGSQMLHGVDLSGVHDGLVVGAGDAQIEGGDGLGAHLVLPGHIQAGEELDMIDGKARDFFHIDKPHLRIFSNIYHTPSMS